MDDESVFLLGEWAVSGGRWCRGSTLSLPGRTAAANGGQLIYSHAASHGEIPKQPKPMQNKQNQGQIMKTENKLRKKGAPYKL